MIYTSGTTGRPKGVMRRDVRRQDRASKRTSDSSTLWGFGPTDVHLIAGPTYHTMPNAYAAQHLFVGATVVLMPTFDAGECLRLIASERVTTRGMVPAHFIRILELPPTCARVTICRACGRSCTRRRRVRRRSSDGSWTSSRATRVWEFYGATEGPGTIISPEEWREQPGQRGHGPGPA